MKPAFFYIGINIPLRGKLMEQVLDYEAHIQEIARSGTDHEEGAGLLWREGCLLADKPIPFARTLLQLQER
jgi:hypothetical protein